MCRKRAGKLYRNAQFQEFTTIKLVFNSNGHLLKIDSSVHQPLVNVNMIQKLKNGIHYEQKNCIIHSLVKFHRQKVHFSTSIVRYQQLPYQQQNLFSIINQVQIVNLSSYLKNIVNSLTVSIVILVFEIADFFA